MQRGKLESFRLFQVLRSILEKKTTGALTLSRDDDTKVVRFAYGQAIEVESSVPGEQLLEALVERGLVSSVEKEELHGLGNDTSVAAAVVERDLVAARRIKRLRGRLARERLMHVFTWPDGEFSFDQSSPVVAAVIEPIDTVELIIEAVGMVVPTPLCERFLTKYPGQVLKSSDRLAKYLPFFDGVFPQPNLTDRVSKLLTTNDVRSMSGDRARNLREGCALILSGMCMLSKGHGAENASAASTSSNRIPQQTGTSKLRKAVVTEAPKAKGRPVQLRASIRPDAKPPVEAAEPRKGEGSTPTQRPSQTTRRVKKAAQPRQALHAAVAPQRARPSDTTVKPAPSAEGMPTEIKEKLDEALELATRLDTVTHYDLLGVERNASEKMIRHAFRRLARDFHVDRFARYGLEKTSLNEVQRVFIAMNRAHEVLADGEERREYDLSIELRKKGLDIADGGAGTQLDEAFKAEKLVKDGSTSLSRGDAERAIECFKKALVYSSEDQVALAGVAYCTFLTAQRQGGSKTSSSQALMTLEKIALTNQHHAEPYLYLGRVYRALNEHAKAVDAFQSALQLDPHLSEAGSELRHSRKQLESGGGLKGFFGLRKK